MLNFDCVGFVYDPFRVVRYVLGLCCSEFLLVVGLFCLLLCVTCICACLWWFEVR